MPEALVLLMTDVVDSTALSQRIGDEAMSAVWMAHDRVARKLLRQWRGREIDKSDGFLLLFHDPRDAASYAQAYHRALGALEVPLQARAGIHVGPGMLRENDPRDVALGAKPIEIDGVAKSLAARVMSIAQGGQTLLTPEAAATLPEIDGCLKSHGHWRLKGIGEVVEVLELGEPGVATAPPIDSPKAYRVARHGELWIPVGDAPHNLPAERDAFIGRHAALEDLGRRVHGGVRLVSIVGPGGTGKTRLAQRFGWTLLGEIPGGVWFCDLSHARSLDGVARAVAQGLGIALGVVDPVLQLGNAIAARGRCLVILDNFEQVSTHAETTLGHWMTCARDAQFVVTSREVLGVQGEDVYALSPLEVAEAASLFMRRAEAAWPDFAPTTHDAAAIEPLMRLLDRLPLAIELAAARVRVMPPRTLLQRMGERFKLLTSKGHRSDRQSTLRAALDWSWDLLSAAERAALAQLSVFEGGFTLSAAERTLDLQSYPGAPHPVDALQSLVEKSLVRRRADNRFDLLMSLQEYAREHLRTPGRYDGSGPAAWAQAQKRHCAYFSTFTESDAVADECAELDNLVSACRQAVALGDVPSAVGALEGSWAALNRRGPFRIAPDLAETVRAMAGLQPSSRARVDRVAGAALRACGRVAEARARYDESLEAARQAGDDATERRALAQIGALDLEAGRADSARSALKAALLLAERANDRTVQCEVLCELGNLLEHLGNLQEARSYYESALRTAREAGDRRWEGGSLGNLGLLCTTQGKMTEALGFYEGGLAIARELGDRRWEGNALCNLGLLHQVQGRLVEAREALKDALAVAREIGYVRLGAVVMCNLGIVLEAMAEPAQARDHFEEALAVARTLGDRRSEGQFLNYLGLLHARQGRFTEAFACLDLGERLLFEVADKLNLGLLLCSRAEAEHLQGSPAAGTLQRARTLANEVGAEPESELGLALAKIGTAIAAADRPGD